MKRAVFLDRDGTIIEDDGYIDSVARIHLFSWSAEAIVRLRKAGFLVVVVTNQAGVARGYFEEAFIDEAHRHLERESDSAWRRPARDDPLLPSFADGSLWQHLQRGGAVPMVIPSGTHQRDRG